jgi:nicotinamide-nucleotide amidase
MSVRAGIVVTGTEVLGGRVTDRNGPWLADRLHELGVELTHITTVGDRPADILAALRFMADQGLNLIATSGGVGPTADDLTAETVGEFQGRAMVLDEALERRINEILRDFAKRRPNLDLRALREGNRKQAMIPAGSVILEPVGTAPGLIVPPQPGTPGPTVVVLPGPPRELQPMWRAAVADGALSDVLANASDYHQCTLRMFGIPESEIAETLRVAERSGIDLRQLEITTCMHHGEIEVVTRHEPHAQEAYEAFHAMVRERHQDTLFSEDGSTIDEQIASLLRTGPGERPSTVVTAESCTGGLLAARLTNPPGASDYVLGGIVAYSNDAKAALAGVPAELIDRHGAVSAEVAQALARGAITAVGADIGVGITGIAGPTGGSAQKPVGLVWFCVSGPGQASLTRSVHIPGSRADVRDRATTVAMHLLRRVLSGQGESPMPVGGATRLKA